MTGSIAKRLEKYTSDRPQEVLLVHIEIDDEPDEIAIYRGFSSSLMRSTAFDPDVPVLPDDANIISIDRATGPYNPVNPQYLQQGITWDAMESLLTQLGV